MFSTSEKHHIADAIQQILRNTGNCELPTGEIQFHLYVEGANPNWQFANIHNNRVASLLPDDEYDRAKRS